MRTVNNLLMIMVLSMTSMVRGEVVDYVDPFIGTDGTGHTFPAACVPFGLIQAGPDTGTADWDHCSGYRHKDRAIYGFSQTHLNGTGGEDLGDVLIAPFTDGPIEKGYENAKPGNYVVEFPSKGIKAEMTASEHVGFYRFNSCNRLFVDCQWGIAHDGRFVTNVLSQVAALEPDGLFTGERETHTWNYRKTSFAISTDRRIVRVDSLPQTNPKEKGRRYILHFEGDNAPLLVKVALSAEGGIAGAKANLAAEIPGWDFDAVKNAARQKWNKMLSVATIEGTDEQKKNWYTSLYHLCIQPNNIADALLDHNRPYPTL